jgi:hypothetical protein
MHRLGSSVGDSMTDLRATGGRVTSILACLALASLVSAAPATAQSFWTTSNAQTPLPSREPRERVDVTVAMSDYRLDIREGRYPRHYFGRPPEVQPAAGVSIGIRWRRRFITEFEYESILHRSDVYDEEIIATPTVTIDVFLSHEYQAVRLAPAQLVGFRAGSRLQPFLGVAVGIDSETVRDRREEFREGPLTDAHRLTLSSGPTPPQSSDTFPTSLPPAVTTRHVHLFGRAGVKVYPLKHLFLLVEGRLGNRVGVASVGVGVTLSAPTTPAK